MRRGEKLEARDMSSGLLGFLSPLARLCRLASPRTPHLCLISRTCGCLLVGGGRIGGDRDLLLILYLLAVNGLLFRADHVGALEGAFLFQGSAGQSITLRVFWGKTQMHTSNQVVETYVETSLYRVYHLGAIALDNWGERSKAIQLHGLALNGHLLQTSHDVLQHQYCHRVVYELAVLTQVLGETLQVQRLLGIGLGVVLAVSGVVLVLVSTQIHRKCNYFTCHSSKKLI